jgi:hypothetical protein
MSATTRRNFIGLTMSSCALIVSSKDWKGSKSMTDKNKKKEDAKKHRNFWPLSPVTRIVESRKKYNRNKDRKNKRLYED